MSTYEEALKAADKAGGVVHQTDEQFMAGICKRLVPLLCGAVSPKLVFEGAQAKGMKAEDVMRLAHNDPMAVAELQWVTP